MLLISPIQRLLRPKATCIWKLLIKLLIQSRVISGEGLSSLWKKWWVVGEEGSICLQLWNLSIRQSSQDLKMIQLHVNNTVHSSPEISSKKFFKRALIDLVSFSPCFAVEFSSPLVRILGEIVLQWLFSRGHNFFFLLEIQISLFKNEYPKLTA